MGFLLAASFFALQRGRLIHAGVLLAQTAIKPQTTILAIIYLLIWGIYRWRERGRFCGALISTIAILRVAATLLWPHWVQSWIQVLLA